MMSLASGFMGRAANNPHGNGACPASLLMVSPDIRDPVYPPFPHFPTLCIAIPIFTFSPVSSPPPPRPGLECFT